MKQKQYEELCNSNEYCVIFRKSSYEEWWSEWVKY